MPEGIGENSDIETKEIPNYIEIGNVPETGKHKNIQELYSLGLNIPPTLVCDYQSLETDSVKEWIARQFEEKDLQIRSTLPDQERNSASMRDPSGTLEEFFSELSRFSKENILKTFIIQAIPKGCINRDILSGNISLLEGNRMMAELWPDLASWGNRINRSPLWHYTVIEHGGRNLQKVTTEEIAERFWNDILYRRGRMFLKGNKEGKIPPKIEKADSTKDYYVATIDYAKSKLENSEDPLDIVKYYYDLQKSGDKILDLFPDTWISSLDRDMRKLLENPNFESNKSAKFSLILDSKDGVIKAEPIYWDLIPQHER